MEFLVQDVFTPTTQAKVNFVSRSTVEDRLLDALNTPGQQIVIYGESGSGKSTLLVNALSRLSRLCITTRCTSSSNYESIILDAYDKLDQFYTESRTSSGEHSSNLSAEASFSLLKAQLSEGLKTSTTEQTRRYLPPQLTPQRLGSLMGSGGVSWVLEDFHRVPLDDKAKISQIFKIFSDIGFDYPNLRIVAIGATDTARQVVMYNPEMRNRVAEIEVPLMTRYELTSILVKGSELLNVDVSEVAVDIVNFSAGLPSVTHHLALNSCRAAQVKSTVALKVHLIRDNLNTAVERHLDESSDTLKATFDAALSRQRTRKYDNTRLILETLASGPVEGMTHAEIKGHIKENHDPSYPSGNVTTYLQKLQTEVKGSAVRRTADGRYRFRDPIMHSYAMLIFKTGTDSFSQDMMSTVLRFVTVAFKDWRAQDV